MVFSKSLVEEAMEYGKRESVKEIRKSTYADVIQSSNKNYNSAKEKKDSVIRNSARNYVVQKWLNSFSEESFNKFLLTIDHNMI